VIAVFSVPTVTKTTHYVRCGRRLRCARSTGSPRHLTTAVGIGSRGEAWTGSFPAISGFSDPLPGHRRFITIARQASARADQLIAAADRPLWGPPWRGRLDGGYGSSVASGLSRINSSSATTARRGEAYA
jgi:hypothetical protein